MDRVMGWFPTAEFWPGAISDATTFVRNFAKMEQKLLAATTSKKEMTLDENLAQLKARGARVL
jgi:hypothetical protein